MEKTSDALEDSWTFYIELCAVACLSLQSAAYDVLQVGRPCGLDFEKLGNVIHYQKVSL
jgi:hypothetical protein